MPQPLTFCPAETTPVTKATYTALYVPPTGITSCVPPLTVIKADGTVDSAALNGFVTTFLSQVSPPTTITAASNMDNAKEFSTKSKALRDSMQAEYCFYYNRYIWALGYVLTNAAQSGAVIDPVVKTKTAELNNKLNGILLVMKASVNSRMNTLNGYYNGDINSQNGNLDTARQRLADHSALLKNNDLKADVQAAMVDYSIEKNSSSRNLLAVYGFMNIVAVGLLFYLYTHTKE